MEKFEIQAPVMSKIQSSKGDFVCGWGDEIDKEFISVHLNDCEVMQDQYGDLYNSLSILLEDAPFLNTMNNIQAVTSFFQNKFERVMQEVSSTFWIELCNYLSSIPLSVSSQNSC